MLNLPVCVISLRHSERRASVQSQLNALPLDWHYIDAVNGREAGHVEEYARKKRLRHYGKDLTPGEIGCFLSHQIAWQQCLHEKKLCLVLEDDFLLRDDFMAALHIAAAHEESYDLLRLHGIFERPYKLVKTLGEYQLVKHLKEPSGTTAYLLSPKSAARLLEKSERFYQAVDDFIDTTSRTHLRLRTLLPYPVATSAAASEIGTRARVKLTRMQKIRRELWRLPERLWAGGYRWWVYWKKN